MMLGSIAFAWLTKLPILAEFSTGTGCIFLICLQAEADSAFRYPGLYCDTEAYIYLPLLEETGYMPSSKYVPGEC
jgi:hypothetical protein